MEILLHDVDQIKITENEFDHFRTYVIEVSGTDYAGNHVNTSIKLFNDDPKAELSHMVHKSGGLHYVDARSKTEEKIIESDDNSHQ